MGNDLNFKLNHGDTAVRLDLISKVYGLEGAERYFSNIPDYLRGHQVYGALLNCYAENKSVEKAEAIMQKMKELNMLKSTLSYNFMLNLYGQMGEFDKLDKLVQEMEEKGFPSDDYTLVIRMNAFISASDIEGMEKLLMKRETDISVPLDWNIYVSAASGYIKAGFHDKTCAMLKKVEELVSYNVRRIAFERLLTLYAAIGEKDEVYRIWNLYKKMPRLFNSGYLSMLSSLFKLDDMDDAERILEEWESGNTSYDVRVPNFLVNAYIKKGQLEKAESYIRRLLDKGKQPDPSTLNLMATGYRLNEDMGKAVKTMKKAILASEPGWKPNRLNIAACIEYLKGKGDMESALQILELLKERVHFSTDIYGKLLDYVHSENPNSKVLDLMQATGFEASV